MKSTTCNTFAIIMIDYVDSGIKYVYQTVILQSDNQRATCRYVNKTVQFPDVCSPPALIFEVHSYACELCQCITYPPNQSAQLYTKICIFMQQKCYFAFVNKGEHLAATQSASF